MRILIVAHQLPPKHIAGTEVYSLRLALALKNLGHVVALASTDDSGLVALGGVSEGMLESIPTFRVGADRVAMTCHQSLFPAGTRGALASVAARFQPDVMHVQHLRWLGLHALEGVREVRLIGTLHDHWALCARDGQLLTGAGVPCDGPSPDRCASCLVGYRFGLSPIEAKVSRALSLLRSSQSGKITRTMRRIGLWNRRRQGSTRSPDPIELEERRRVFLDLGSRFDRWIAPSRSVAQAHIAFGFDSRKVDVIPHGVDGDGGLGHQPRDGGPLRVSYLGTVAPPKGVHVLVEAARALPEGLIQLDIHGRSDLRPEYAARMSEGGLPNHVKFHGTFSPKDAAGILARTDLAVVPSVWPENHPLVIAEALAARVPVLASDIGGIPELVHEGVNGRLVPPNDPARLASVLRELAVDSEQLLRLRAGIVQPMSFEEHAKRVVLAYDRTEES